MMKKYFILAFFFILYGCNNHQNNQNKGFKLYSQSGDIQYNQNNFAKAKVFYSLAYIHDTTNALFEYRIGVCNLKLDKFKESILYFEKSINHKYRIGHSYFNIGLCYTCLFNDTAALHFFNKALLELPNEQYVISEIVECKSRLQLKSKEYVSN